jgi:hypothetical protein
MGLFRSALVWSDRRQCATCAARSVPAPHLHMPSPPESSFALQQRPDRRIGTLLRFHCPMLLTRCKRSLRTMALLLMCFVVLTPLAGSRIFVSAALQRGEFHAGVVLHDRAVGPAARADGHAHRVATAVAAGNVSSLNLFLHLSGIFAPAISTDWLARPSGGTLAAVTATLPEWGLVFAIFEPPRRCASLS